MIILNPIYQMPKTLLIQQDIFIFVITHCRNSISITLFVFYVHYLHLLNTNTSFALIQQIHQLQHQCFILHFTNH